MTIYEKMMECSEEDMVQFLYNFARDTIDKFSEFIMPSERAIEHFLQSTIPGTENDEDE